MPPPPFSFTRRAFTRAIPLLRSPVVLIGAMALPVGLMAILRGTLTARYFGAGATVDAFMVAQALGLFLVNVAGYSLGIVSVPEVARVRAAASHETAKRFVYTLLSIGALKFLLISLLICVSAPFYVAMIGAHFDEATRRLSTDLVYVFACFFFFSAFAAQMGALLNVSGSYGAPALSQIFVPGIGCIALIAFYAEDGIGSLAWGLVLGAFAQCVLLFILLVQKVGFPQVSFSAARPSFGRLSREYGLLACAAALMAATQFVDLGMAANLGSGNVSALAFGGLIPALAVAFIGTAVSGPALSAFSEQLASGEIGRLVGKFNRYLALCLALTAVPTALLIGLSSWLVDLLFVHRDAGLNEAATIDQVQRLLLLQIPFYAAGIVAVRMLTALQLNRLIMTVAAASLALKVVLNLTLVSTLGVAGIALSTTAVYVFTLCFCWFLVVSTLTDRTLAIKRGVRK